MKERMREKDSYPLLPLLDWKVYVNTYSLDDELYKPAIYELEFRNDMGFPEDCQPFSRLAVFYKGILGWQNGRKLTENPYTGGSFCNAWEKGWHYANEKYVTIKVVG